MASRAAQLTSIDPRAQSDSARYFEIRSVGSALLTTLVSALVESVMPDSHIELVQSTQANMRPTDVWLGDLGTGRSLVVFGTPPDREAVGQHLNAGVYSLIAVDATRAELLLAVDSLRDGPAFVSASIVRSIATDAIPTGNEIRLTSRELEIARLVANGLSNREMAEELCLSFNTIRSHLQSISSKLGVRTRAKMVVRARDLGIV